jgi:hypothetical protein
MSRHSSETAGNSGDTPKEKDTVPAPQVPTLSKADDAAFIATNEQDIGVSRIEALCKSDSRPPHIAAQLQQRITEW